MSSSDTPSPRAIKTDSTVAYPASTSTSKSDRSSQMATAISSGLSSNMPSASVFATERPRLPPIMSVEDFSRGLQQPPLLSPGAAAALYRNPSHNTSAVSSPLHKGLHRSSDQHGRDDVFNPVRSSYDSLDPHWPSHTSSHEAEVQEIPSKRAYSTMSSRPERQAQPYPHPLDSPTQMDLSFQSHRSMYSNLPPSSRSSLSEHKTSTRNHSLAATNITDYSSVQLQRSNAHRCSLYIRQQPRAARAGPDGKDRRAIDPPPVLQLMINDFDSNSDDDMNELRSSYFVVHCRLVSAHSPKRDMSTLSQTNDDGSTEVQRLLLGTSVASPFFCADDPDLDSMPTHPTSKQLPSDQAPPSPTSRFIMPRGPGNSTRDLAASSSGLPGTFFIFADLSIRRAGEYRLEFCLMKVEPSTMVAGSKLPILHSVTSQVFRVVNAKDFDQVQPSTDLVKGLLDRGAGFPLKLKKGTREGGRRRNATDSEGGGESIGGGDGDEDDEDNEDG